MKENEGSFGQAIRLHGESTTLAVPSARGCKVSGKGTTLVVPSAAKKVRGFSR